MPKIKTQNEAIKELFVRKAYIKQSGNITELVGMSADVQGSPVVKLNADEYIVKNTGEVRLYQHTENRLQGIKGVRKSLRDLRDIINSNVLIASHCRWVTLTYAENMLELPRLYTDFKDFWRRFQKWCTKTGCGIPQYIAVPEPQARGAWHLHLVLIWETDAPFIDNNEVMQKLWGQGFTKTKAMNGVDNIGAYFSAYLADMELDELSELSAADQVQVRTHCSVVQKEFSDDKGTLKRKQFIKGARLYLYPTGMKLFRTSRGIRKPWKYEINTKQYESIVKTYSEGKEKSQLGTLTFSCNSSIVAEDGKLINSINRLYFNTKSALNAERAKNESCE